MPALCLFWRHTYWFFSGLSAFSAAREMRFPHVVQDMLWVSGFQPRSHLELKYLRPWAVWSPCYWQFQVHTPLTLLQLFVFRIQPDIHVYWWGVWWTDACTKSSWRQTGTWKRMRAIMNSSYKVISFMKRYIYNVDCTVKRHKFICT